MYGIVFYHMQVGTLNINNFLLLYIDYLVNNNNILGLNFMFIIFLVYIFFKLGLAPFHLWVTDVYNEVALGFFGSFMVINKFVMILVYVKLIMLFPILYQNTLYIHIVIGSISILIGSVGALLTSSFRSLLIYSSITNFGIIFCLFGLPSQVDFSVLYTYIYDIYHINIFLNINTFIQIYFENISMVREDLILKYNLPEFWVVFMDNIIIPKMLDSVDIYIYDKGHLPLINFDINQGLYLNTLFNEILQGDELDKNMFSAYTDFAYDFYWLNLINDLPFLKKVAFIKMLPITLEEKKLLYEYIISTRTIPYLVSKVSLYKNISGSFENLNYNDIINFSLKVENNYKNNLFIWNMFLNLILYINTLKQIDSSMLNILVNNFLISTLVVLFLHNSIISAIIYILLYLLILGFLFLFFYKLELFTIQDFLSLKNYSIILFLIIICLMFTIAGLPPFLGFYLKLLLLYNIFFIYYLTSYQVLVVMFGYLVLSLISLYIYYRIVLYLIINDKYYKKHKGYYLGLLLSSIFFFLLYFFFF